MWKWCGGYPVLTWATRSDWTVCSRVKRSIDLNPVEADLSHRWTHRSDSCSENRRSLGLITHIWERVRVKSRTWTDTTLQTLCPVLLDLLPPSSLISHSRASCSTLDDSGNLTGVFLWAAQLCPLSQCPDFCLWDCDTNQISTSVSVNMLFTHFSYSMRVCVLVAVAFTWRGRRWRW